MHAPFFLFVYFLQKAIWSVKGPGSLSPSVSDTFTVRVTRYAHGLRFLTTNPFGEAVPKKSTELDAPSGVSVKAYPPIGAPGPSIVSDTEPRFGWAAVKSTWSWSVICSHP
jgi:hypothetical protein